MDNEEVVLGLDLDPEEDDDYYDQLNDYDDDEDDEEPLPLNTKPSDDWAWFKGYNIDTDTSLPDMSFSNGEPTYIRGWVSQGGFDRWCVENFKWMPSLMTIYLVSTAGNILAFNRRME